MSLNRAAAAATRGDCAPFSGAELVGELFAVAPFSGAGIAGPVVVDVDQFEAV